MSSKRVHEFNVGQNSHLTVYEATVLKQVIDDIGTGKYKPEQYSSLFEEHFKQHPSLKKNMKVVRDRQIKKLLEELQVYLPTQNNFEGEPKGEPPAQSDQKVARKNGDNSKIIKSPKQNVSNKSTPSNVDNTLLTVNETTVWNQVINEIRTGRYKPEQYSSLFEEHFKQHPSLRKNNKVVRDRQIKKLLNKLQVYLTTQNDLGKAKNQEQPAQCDQKDQKVAGRKDKNLQQNTANKIPPSIVNNLNVNEATVLNQVIDEIRTGRYKPEQYSDLFEQRFKQHPALKKYDRTRKKRQIKTLLDALQAFLVTENNSEKRNGQHSAEDEPQEHFEDAKKERHIKTDRNMCNNDLMSDFTVREATIFNQVIKKIKTGKYQPEQYSNLIGEHIDQHPTLKKQKSSVRDRHKRKMFKHLENYLAILSNFEKERNEEQLTEETSSVKTTRDFHTAQTRRAAADASINKPGDLEDQAEFDIREIQVKLPKLCAETLRKCKSSLVEEAVVETPAKESTGREKFSKLKKVKSRNRRKSVIVDSEEADENKGCGNSKRYEKTTKSTENADEFSDCESGEEYNFVNDIPEDGEEDTSSKVIARTKSVGSFDTQSSLCGKEDNEKSEKLSEDESDLSDENITNISKTKSSSSEVLDAYQSEVVSIHDSSSEEDEENGDYMTYSDIMTDLTHDEDSSSDSESTSLKVEAGQNIQLSQESLSTDESLQLEENKETWQNVSLLQNISLDALRISPPIQRRTLILQENIKIDGSNNSALSQRINNLVQFFGSTVPKGKFSLNLSLEQKDSQNPPQEESEGNSEAVNGDTDESKSQEDEISSPQLNGKVEDESVSQIENSVSTSADDELGRKRRLNRSLSEILADNKKTKRLKVQSEPLDANYLKNCQIITPSSSIGEDMWKVSPISNLKPSTSSSTRVNFQMT